MTSAGTLHLSGSSQSLVPGDSPTEREPMQGLTRPQGIRKWTGGTTVRLLVWGMMAISLPSAWGLITGGEGNKPIGDPGWPDGAAAVFNTEHRVAYWEGPPFGGGQYHAECRGDSAALEEVLEDFANIDTPRKRVVLHDGVARSFWLNIGRDKDKKDPVLVDWVFMAWVPDRLKFQQGLPAGRGAVAKDDTPILAQLDVYTGGQIDWDEVNRPDGIEIIDQRLEAHGFTVEDGTVLEGTAIDLATRRPLAGTLVLEKIEPQQQGGYLYTKLVETKTDVDGHWVIKKAPAEWCRLVLTSQEYVPRVIGYGRYDGQPQWIEHNSGLSKPGQVTGRVVDDQGQPLVDVDVRLDGLTVADAGHYELPSGATVSTDAAGRFEFAALPLGSASVWVRKSGYVRPGLGAKIEVPAADLKFEMQPAAKLQVIVDFSATKRPKSYLVEVKPEGGEEVGKWSGSGLIDEENQITYDNIPPGKYVITSRPNPGSENQTTDPVTIDLQGGKLTEVTLPAK